MVQERWILYSGSPRDRSFTRVICESKAQALSLLWESYHGYYGLHAEGESTPVSQQWEKKLERGNF